MQQGFIESNLSKNITQEWSKFALYDTLGLFALNLISFKTNIFLREDSPSFHNEGDISHFFKEWRVVLIYKSAFYLSITYYCNGLIAEENKKHGETLCYYENALERLTDGWKTAEKISSEKTNLFKEAHAYLNDIIIAK